MATGHPPSDAVRPTRPIVTLTTDFGVSSRYVGEMKGALLCVAPDAAIVDLTHAVPPQDVATAARWLADAVPVFPRGTLHVVVVDPGVGTDRSIVYAELGQQRFVCPDNGLLTNLAEAHPPGKIVRVENERFWRNPVSNTFHGRDIMAPVAGWLCRGTEPTDLGPTHPPDALVRLTDGDAAVPVLINQTHGQAGRENGGDPGVAERIEGEVIEVDSFGNLITNITAATLDGAPRDSTLVVSCDEHKTFGLQAAYGDQPEMTLVALLGSGDRLELAIVNDSASAMLGVRVGAPVVVEW